jgi:hypothetical protein
MFHRIGRILDILSIFIVLLIVGSSDVPRFTESADRTRVYTREIEFDYPNWVWDAAWLKVGQAAIHAPHTLDRGTGRELVFEYLRTTLNILLTEQRIEEIYADPEITDKEAATALLREQLAEYLARQERLAPFKESILQNQVSETLAELDLTPSVSPCRRSSITTRPRRWRSSFRNAKRSSRSPTSPSCRP